MIRQLAVCLRIGRWPGLVGALAGLVAGASTAQAQRADSARTPAKADTTVAPVAKLQVQSRLTPPLTPRRAFMYSAMLPGFGQSRLDRGTSGALFASVEMAAIIMVRRSRADLREARTYRIDTLPSEFTVTGTTISESGVFTNKYSGDLVKTRQLHVEDWLAAIAFNHLFAGADAFVAAQLWDTPVSLSAIPHRNGTMLVATLRW